MKYEDCAKCFGEGYGECMCLESEPEYSYPASVVEARAKLNTRMIDRISLLERQLARAREGLTCSTCAPSGTYRCGKCKTLADLDAMENDK